MRLTASSQLRDVPAGAVWTLLFDSPYQALLLQTSQPRLHQPGRGHEAQRRGHPLGQGVQGHLLLLLQEPDHEAVNPEYRLPELPGLLEPVVLLVGFPVLPHRLAEVQVLVLRDPDHEALSLGSEHTSKRLEGLQDELSYVGLGREGLAE